MTPRDPAKTTQLLHRVASGDAGAAEQLLPLVYDELRAIAQRLMSGERKDHTLQPTALMHEAFVRLVDQTGSGWNDRVHFLRVAARAMRNVLVDHARARRAEKRGGDRARVTLDDGIGDLDRDAHHILSVHESLSRLTDVDPQLGQIVELRFFAGLPHQEIADALGTSLRTVERGWRLARAWLLQDLEREGNDDR